MAARLSTSIDLVDSADISDDDELAWLPALQVREVAVSVKWQFR